ncbi:MAG: M48 family metalloprotease [Firmicutes bacterium]|nr:M48 family metalloprotease [Bacillota bacterium]
MKTNLRYIIALILTLILALPAIYAGSRLELHRTVALVFTSIGFALIIALPLSNTILYFCRRSSVKKSQLDKMRKDLLREREETKNFASKEVKINLFAMLCYAVIFLMFAAPIFLLIGAWIFIDSVAVMVIVIALSSCLIGYIIYHLLPKPAAPIQGLLYPNKFAMLHRSIRKAASMVSCNLPYSVYLENAPSVSISVRREKISIFIGKDILRLLNETELTTVMLHEFAHVLHGDHTIRNHAARLDNLAEIKVSITRLFAGQLFGVFVDKASRYIAVSSKQSEEAADRIVAEKGLAQQFINAMAKLTLYDYYLDALDSQSVYESEKPPSCIYQLIFNNFLEAYAVHGEMWRKMCRQELPWRFGSHPACSERMKNLNIADFHIDFANLNEEALSQSKAAYTYAAQLAGIDYADWTEIRQINYVMPLKVIQHFEESGEADSLREVAEAYFSLCRYEDCLKIVQQILDANPRVSFALYTKGVILCDKFDDDGLDYIQKAVDINLQYAESGIEIMSKYLLRQALSARREALRAWSDEKADELYTFMKQTALRGYRDVEKHDFPAETVEKLSKALQDAGVEECRILKFGKTRRAVYYALVKPYCCPNSAKYERTMQKISSTLELFGEFYVYDRRLNRTLYKIACRIQGSGVLTPQPSMSEVRYDKLGNPDRRLKRFNAGVAYFCLYVIMLPIGATLIIMSGIFDFFDIPQMSFNGVPLYLLVAGLAVFATVVILIIPLYIADAAAKKYYASGKFTRARFEFLTDADEETLFALKRYLEYIKFKKTTYKNEEHYALGKMRIKITHYGRNTVIEGFILTERAAGSYESGLYGTDNAIGKSLLRQRVRVILDILDAPSHIKV